ncbi:MAG: ATP-dependent protease ATPase subunit HslU [Planctomyces sp.]|nr:ATP-dependent protease ATPase subunit HslU [Planctomyces sp.]
MTPQQIVRRLDEHIVGQAAAKRAVAVALRNRWRWQRLPDDLRTEITPKNIIMIGPTGVGKTEITRRLATLTGAPFVKVEATKYTEVGYVGRDVESMIRDLVEAAIQLIRQQRRSELMPQVEQRVEQRLVELLAAGGETGPADGEAEARRERVRDRLREMLRRGEMEDREVELRVEQRQTPVQMFPNMGMEQMDVGFQNLFEKVMPRQHAQRRMPVREARRVLQDQEFEAQLDKAALADEALRLAERQGIIFLDELDKVCGSEGGKQADVSREGVQRDLLPIVEGTTVQTRYGLISTNHILFIAAGAFHRSRPSDLMPELQGRFPIRVELQDLTRDDFLRILTEPTSALTRQYAELLAVDGVQLEFHPDGLAAIADLAWQVNQSTQNIGARRLHTLLERLLEEASYAAPDSGQKHVAVDAAYVAHHLAEAVKTDDLSKFIL